MYFDFLPIHAVRAGEAEENGNVNELMNERLMAYYRTLALADGKKCTLFLY